jgi:hypothetical protein
MQPTGFKETGANITSFDGLSPALAHLGASLGNQAFHTVASQQKIGDVMHDVSKHAAAGTERFQANFQNQMKKIKQQRENAMKKSSGDISKETLNKEIPSMADMMKSNIKKKNNDGKVGPMVTLSEKQKLFFEKHPDLYQEFQQQQNDLIEAKRDGAAVKKALFGSLTPPPPPPLQSSTFQGHDHPNYQKFFL